MIHKSRLMYGVEIWGINGGSDINNGICGIPRSTNSKHSSRWELGTKSRKGTMLSSIVKFW
jgi:hypothetical protein